MNPLAFPVAIVGAGPTGLALALGLARHGVRSRLFEQNASTSEYSKAPGVHIRTREIFRQWGVESRMLAAGQLVGRLSLHAARGTRRPFLSVDFTELDDEADGAGLLLLEQGRMEALLLDAVRESGLCDVHFGTEVVGLAPHASGATLAVRNGGAARTVEAAFVVGCDGANSFVRGTLGLPFDGITYPVQAMLADVRVEDGRDALPWPRLWNRRGGFSVAIRLRPTRWRIICIEPGTPAERRDVAGEDVRGQTARLLGAGPPPPVEWASRFRIHRRSAPGFYAGRVLLAGDAAHIHSPVGGQGMNAGIQDAHNLAWKLAQALRGGDVDRLLASYDVERRAVVVGHVTRYTDVVTRAFLQTPAIVRLGAFTVARLALRIPRLRRTLLRRATMIDLGYRASPLLNGRDPHAGRRLPNPVLHAPDGSTVRLYDLLPAAPLLIEAYEGRPRAGEAPLKQVVRLGPGSYTDPKGVLRSLFPEGGGWMLVRPDAHIAWVRETADDMRMAIERALGAGDAS